MAAAVMFGWIEHGRRRWGGKYRLLSLMEGNHYILRSHAIDDLWSRKCSAFSQNILCDIVNAPLKVFSALREGHHIPDAEKSACTSCVSSGRTRLRWSPISRMRRDVWYWE